jgi:adenylylsulfate reductase subunit B
VKLSYGPRIDKKYCTGCADCYKNCPMDVFGWDEAEKLPVVSYPGECIFCCVCELTCSEKAIDVRFPLHTMLDFNIDPRNV